MELDGTSGSEGAITVDFDHLPVLRFIIDGHQTEGDAQVYTEAVDRVLAQHRPYAVLHLVHSFGPSVAMASAIARWSLTRTKQLRQYCLGGAVITDSGLFSFFMSSFQLVAPLPAPVYVVPTEEQGMEWIRGQFAARDITL